MSQEIQDANAGGNASQGGANCSAAGTNGSSPWGTMPNIDAEARWVCSGGGNRLPVNPAQEGCDAGECEVFRIAVAPAPDDSSGWVPKPVRLAL